MWRRISGVIFLVLRILILGAELFSIIALDYYLVFNTAFIVFRVVIALVLISLGIKLIRENNQDTTETDELDDTDETNYWQ